MNEQTVRFRLGIFVLAALILLGVLVILFGGSPTFLQPADHFSITFDNAAGVTPGTPVRRSGVKIGEVESVELDDQTSKVLVTIRVQRPYSIFESEEPIIVRNMLGGEARIDFVPAQPPAPPPKKTVPPGSTIPGKTQAEPSDVFQKAGKVFEPTEDAMKEMKKVLQKIDRMAPLLEDTIKEYQELAKASRKLVPAIELTNKEIQELAKATRDTIPDLKKTNDEVQALAKATRAILPDLKKTNDEIQALAKATRELVPDLKKTNQEFQELIKVTRQTVPTFQKTGEELQVTARNWSKVGERLDVLLATNERKLVSSLEKLEETLEQLTKVFGDENEKNLRTTLRNVAEASKQLDSITRNTEAFLVEGRKTMARVGESLGRTESVFKNLETATKPFADRSESITKNLDETTAELNKLTADLRAVMRQVVRSEGTIQRLLSDPSLYQELDRAAAGINKLVPRLDRILRDVETFADRIARHPELIGVGGALRPSSGLKDLPLTPTWRPSQ